jgi:hypothetical protein
MNTFNLGLLQSAQQRVVALPEFAQLLSSMSALMNRPEAIAYAQCAAMFTSGTYVAATGNDMTGALLCALTWCQRAPFIPPVEPIRPPLPSLTQVAVVRPTPRKPVTAVISAIDLSDNAKLTWKQVRVIGSLRWPKLTWLMRDASSGALPRCAKHLPHWERCSKQCRRKFWNSGVKIVEIDRLEHINWNVRSV